MKNILIIALTCFYTSIVSAQEIGKPLPKWKEGQMEIHHINTGRGVCSFCILPDGTTMLIDAGDLGPRNDLRQTQAKPNERKQPGEWVARYISNRKESISEIDYVFLTHFHSDHMGGVFKYSPKTNKGGEYYLSGLSEVYEYIPFVKMVDRDWPSYKYNPPVEKHFENYKAFINWNTQNEDMKMERFKPGTNQQFRLVNFPERYQENFEIRNIVSNGEVWTGKGDETHAFFPEGVDIYENLLSAGVRISYGDFDYFNGGDLTGRIPLGSEPWKDIETEVGKVLGPIEVCEANHHANPDAMGELFLSNVQPQVIVIQLWHVIQLNLTVMRSMANKSINPNLKHIIPTNVPEISKSYLGDHEMKKLTGDGGHVVIKVEPGGKRYSVILLADEDESYEVKSIHGPYNCIEKTPVN